MFSGRRSQPFSDREAWLWLIGQANHTERQVYVGKWVVIPRGAFITTYRDLTREFRWGVNRLRRFFSCCEADQMVCLRSERKWTQISIVNYDTYQTSSFEKDTKTERKRNDNGTITERTKELKELKELKESKFSLSRKKKEPLEEPALVQFGRHLRMSQAEMDKCTSKFGVALVNQEIPEADEWISYSEKPSAVRYREPDHDHYLFFRTTWLVGKAVSLSTASNGDNHSAANQKSKFEKNMDEARRLEQLERQGLQ